MRDVVINARRGPHKEQEAGIPPTVKKITAREKQPVLSVETKLPIAGYDENKKNKVYGRVEKHACSFLVRCALFSITKYIKNLGRRCYCRYRALHITKSVIFVFIDR